MERKKAVIKPDQTAANLGVPEKKLSETDLCLVDYSYSA